MNEKEYLDQIFDQYVPTKELLELKEEISINLHESIVDYLKEGMDKQEAFSKAVEDLGELDQIMGRFIKKKANIWKWLYYISGVSIIIGILVALITFFDQIGWNGAFLSLGCLYPFCVIQSAYILWYKMEKTKKWDGGILQELHPLFRSFLSLILWKIWFGKSIIMDRCKD